MSVDLKDAVAKKLRMSLSEVAEREGVSYATAFRWTSSGVRGIRLRFKAVGGRRWVEESWLEDFRRQIDEAAGCDAEPALTPAQTERRKASQVADAKKSFAEQCSRPVGKT